MSGAGSSNERRSLSAGIVVAALMIAQQVGAKATRDAFFLSQHGAEYLPHVMVGSALLSLVTAFVMARVLLRVGPSRSVPFVFGASALLFMIEWACATRWPQLIAVLIYVHLGALGPLVISGFWSVVNERFDPHRAKMYVTRMGASAAAGGALGGLLAERVATSLSLLAMLPVLAVANFVCALALPTLGGKSSFAPAPVSEVQPLRVSGYLKKVAAVVLLTSAAAGLIDFAIKAEAAAVMTEPEELAAFFAYLHAVLGVLSFVVQSLVSARLLRTLGLGATLALLPAVVIVGATVGAVFTRLWSVILAKGLETSVRNSAFRSGYELLYIPVERREKRAAKTVIDVGADRAGDILAAVLAMASFSVLPQASVSFTLAASVAISLLSLVFALALHRGYVAELAASLRSGAVAAEEIGVRDATTARTLADTTMALNREELLAEIEALRRERAGESAAESASAASVPDALAGAALGGRADATSPRLLLRAGSLLQGNATRVNELLSQPDLEPELLPMILPWLAKDGTVKHALAALRRVGRSNEGQLADAMLDKRHSARVRAMLPRVLRNMPTERARDGLLYGLGSDAFEVRHQAARGLARLCSQHPELRPAEPVVFAAIQRELRRGSPTEDELSRAVARVSDRPPSVLKVPAFDFALTLLSVIYEPEPLALCRTAFARGDSMMRGTAVEYLENLLPADLFKLLLPHFDIDAPSVENRRLRQRAEIVADLASSATSLEIDVDAIRNT